MEKQCIELHHEKLDVYKAAIDFLVISNNISVKYPRGFSPMGDQLRRASLSIPLNISEGYGRTSKADRARFYDIARGSAHECGAIFDASLILKFINDEQFREGKVLLYRIVSMLVKMAF